MKIKLLLLLLLLLLLRVRSKKKHRGGGARSATFCRNMGTARGVPGLMGRRLQYSSPRHMSQNSRGIFCPLNVGFCKFSCQTQKNLHGGREEQNFLSEIWVQQGLSQLSVTRIAGRKGTPLRWGNPHVHIISPTVTPPIK